jgi:hypothetical protein
VTATAPRLHPTVRQAHDGTFAVVAGPEIMSAAASPCPASLALDRQARTRALYVRLPNAETSGFGVYLAALFPAIDPYAACATAALPASRPGDDRNFRPRASSAPRS